jgi:hypothetical protein
MACRRGKKEGVRKERKSWFKEKSGVGCVGVSKRSRVSSTTPIFYLLGGRSEDDLTKYIYVIREIAFQNSKVTRSVEFEAKKVTRQTQSFGTNTFLIASVNQSQEKN